AAVVANITKLGSVLESWYDVCAAADKLGHLIDLPLERRDGEPLPGEVAGVAIRLDGVRCDADAAAMAEERFDLEIAAGERVALLGSTGGSASRLLDVLYGLVEPNAGHVTVDGLDLRQLRLDRTRDDFALVHGTEIVDGSVLENIRFGRAEITAAAVRDALQDVALWDEIVALPQGLETELATGGPPLSASQASRLMLARAIVGTPRLLLLDGALDMLTPALRARVSEHLFDRRHRWTVLVVTTASDVAAACDRCIVFGPALAGAAE
ncbi:MAG: ABC transporter ATP-binding protein, partial [Planctomycetes bacterium]|nr:ABC transporter ATP-binding protein [Planctomycetota bacterium]